jgi:hypothetical protein
MCHVQDSNRNHFIPPPNFSIRISTFQTHGQHTLEINDNETSQRKMVIDASGRKYFGKYTK